MCGTRTAATLAALAATALIAAGCGDGDEGDPPGGDGTQTTTEATTAGSGPAGDGRGGVRLEKLGDFDQPVFVAQPPDSEDLYVVEKPGTVQRVTPGGERSQVLDISGEVSDSGEQGLLSVAFPPDFESSRVVYAYYSDSDEDQRVVELPVAEDGTFAASRERLVLEMDDFASNHNGGLMLFGPDDALYIGTGDGGIADDPERNGQDTSSLLGKILRIDPAKAGGRPYTPLGAVPGGAPEVFAYGLRNPWRFSFDRSSAALLIGDVGQNNLEEIDYVTAERSAGANFGWSAFEGDERFNEDQQAPGHVKPIHTYGRDGGCSITGGYVVRDPELPSLRGRYLYGDFCTGQLRSLIASESRARDDRGLGLEVPSLTSFAEDREGRIYATSLDGPVFRLVP